MHDACRKGDHRTARAIQQRLSPLIAALELDTNPVPVKCALSFLRGLEPDVRLPLVPLLPQTADLVRKTTLAFAEDEARPLARSGR